MGLILVSSASALPLTFESVATPEQIAIQLDATGYAQGTSATCRYRETGGQWNVGHDLFRVQPTASNTPALGSVSDVFAWPIIDLTPGTEYEVEVTVGSDIYSATTTTRALPSAAGAVTDTITAGSTSAQIQTAFNNLSAGDVLQFQNGNYTLSGVSLGAVGTAQSPIYIRGESRDGVVLTDTTGAIITLNTVTEVIIENLTMVGSGVDDATFLNPSIAFEQSDQFLARNLTIRNITCTGVDRFVDLYLDAQGVLVYDTTSTGNNLWTVTPTDFLDGNLSWNDSGIKLPGNGNCAWQNTITGFGDTFSYASHSGNDTTGPGTNIHFYRNDVINSTDDPVEVDHAIRNCSWYDNRCTNSINMTSLDPLYGGPWVGARNVYINPYRVTTHKWNDNNSGHFFYNNTIVATVSMDENADIAAWYQPNNGTQEYYGYVNNVHIYRGTGQLLWLDSPGHSNVDWCNNAWFSDGAIDLNFQSWASLSAAQASPPTASSIFFNKNFFEDDVVTVTNPFDVTVTLGANALTEVSTFYTPRIASGQTPKNAGIAIPNITDGFTGVAPDMGALPEGLSIPTYGDQSATPSYISSMSDYQVRRLTSTYVPTNGNESMGDVTPAEWLTSDPATGGSFPRVITAWSGGAGGNNQVYVHGGGHNDSANNGLYAFDFSGDAAPTGWTLESISAVADVRNISGAFTTYSDGLPGSVHTYDGCWYDSNRDEFYRVGGSPFQDGGFEISFFRYDLTSWTELTTTSLSGVPMSVFDATSGRAMFTDWGNANVYFFDPTTGNITSSATGGGSNTASENTMILDTSRDRALVIGGGNTRMWNINWSAQTATATTYSATGSTAVLADQGPSGFYDPVRDSFWLWGGNDIGAGGPYTEITEMDASTFACTTTSFTGDSFLHTEGFQLGSFNRFVFLEDWRAIGFVTATNSGAYVIKLPDS